MPDVTHFTLEDVTVEFGAGGRVVRAVSRVSADVARGSLVVVVGPAGSGKTSLLGCITGRIPPTSGVVHVDGGDGDRAAAVVDGLPPLADGPGRSVEDAVAAVLGTTAEDGSAAVQEVLSVAGLASFGEAQVDSLSAGRTWCLRAALAAAGGPALIVVDDCTLGIPQTELEGVAACARSIASGSTTVVVATDDRRLEAIADHVIDLIPDLWSDGAPTPVELDAGEILFRQGSWGDRIYVVEDGEIELVAERSDGPADLLATAVPGDYFGEISPLLNLPRAATARARVRSTVVGYTAADFHRRVRDHRISRSAMARIHSQLTLRLLQQEAGAD